jgi:AcrR family transcriptional regulator
MHVSAVVWHSDKLPAMSSGARSDRGARSDAGSFRRVRERELIDATRRLFDERGVQDAPIDEIARAVGINRALIYRHFSSKEELFVLTVTDYLAELAGDVRGAVQGADGPRERLERGLDAYAAFCLRYPAFLDCALSLMRRPAAELHASISESVWFRLGQGMAALLSQLADDLARGKRAGVFDFDEPDFAANLLYTQVLGAMHLARLGGGIRAAAPGIPELFRIDPERVRAACVASALATVLAA